MNRFRYAILSLLFVLAAYPGAGAESEGLDALTDALLRRDPAAAKPHFEFPVARPGPVPALTEENFAELFPVVFDEEFHAVFAPAAHALGTHLWTEYPGAGTGAPPGLWCGIGGRVRRISYIPAAQRAAAASYGRAFWVRGT